MSGRGMRNVWQPSLHHPSVADIEVTLKGTAGGDRVEYQVPARDVATTMRELFTYAFVQIDTVIAPNNINMRQVLLTQATRIGRPVVHRWDGGHARYVGSLPAQREGAAAGS
jgi:hypothetical protein